MNTSGMGGPTLSRHHHDGSRRHSGVTLRHSPLAGLVGGAAAVVLLAACGSTSAGSTSSSAGTVSNSSPAGSATSPASTTPVVMVGMATVNGSSEQVLTEANGYTLYYNTHDTSTTASCTGACAGIWPPLLLSSGQPTSASSLPKSLTMASTVNGTQVEYDGHLLYRYSGDSGADQSHGEGIEGIWFVATPSLGSSSSTTSPSAAANAPGY
jgi:predicted lipoprotein with Yx(FWY)xxD motif